MASNLDRFKEDIARLLKQGGHLLHRMQLDCDPDVTREMLEKAHGDKTDDYIENLPSINRHYQSWYSEARALLKQVLPDRVADFARHYEKPRPRKDLDYDNYRIEDFLQGLTLTRGGSHTIVGLDGAVPHLRQQVAIVRAAKQRFESSLFDIRQLVQADLFDSELEAAEALLKHKYNRAAGAIAGVVLERHLAQVCADRALSIGKKNPGIADLNEALKSNGVIEVPDWRFIQHLADIRNICDHSRQPDPTPTQITDLIAGVKKIIKTVY